MAQSIAPIVLRMPTAADPATLLAALSVPERAAAWFTTASPLGAVGTPYTLDFGDGSVVDGSSARSCRATGSRTAGTGMVRPHRRRRR